MTTTSMLASAAKAKLCPFISGNCLANGCMAWVETDDGAKRLELPWPEEIPRPKVVIDPSAPADTRGQMVRLRDDSEAALQPLVGSAHEDGVITRVKPTNHQLSLITVTVVVDSDARGHCRHFPPRP